MGFRLHTVTIGILGWGALFSAPATAQSSVMGIDYGTDFFKVALAAPAKNLDIVLNRDYKRKTQSQVLVNGLVRHYGVDADSKFVRMTDKMYPAVKSILGRLFSDPSCATYRERYSNGMVEDPERHTPLFRQTDEVAYTPEQILAMQLQYARETATAEAGHLVSKAVITVPPFFDQFERQAVLDAANLAGVRAIALVNDGSAVAYTYAMGKTFAKPQNVLFYDVGSGSTTATLVKLDTDPKDDSTLVSMKSFGYDRTLGGFEIDARLQKHLGDLFMKKFGDKLEGSVFESSRARVKLLKEAHRVKHILSANTEAMSSIEGLEGHDFKTKVTREELENLMQDLVPRFTKPIDNALNNAKLTPKDVDTVIVVGGGVRIPFILKLLESHVGEGKVAKSVNGDEAAVMGATLYAASLTIPLRGKKLILRDMAPYPVEVSTDTVEPTIVFPAGSEVNSRKALSFRHQKDFQVLVSYLADQNLSFSELSRVSVTGLNKAAEQYSPEDLGQPLPKVRLSFVMSESGLVSLAKAEAAFNVTNKETESTSIETEATETTETTTTTTTSSADATPPSPFKIVKVTLDTHVEPLGVPAMSPTAKTAARTRFAEMDKDDRLRRERSEAINNFEKLLFFVIDTMEEAPYATYITPEALEALVAEAHTQIEWVDEEKETASTVVFLEKHAAFKKKVDEVIFRKEEHEHRPVLIVKLESTVDAARALLTSYLAKYSPEELESVRKELDNVKNQAERTSTWLQEMITKQEPVALTETPVLLSKDLRGHLNLVQGATKKLTSRKVRKLVTSTSTTDEQVQTSSSTGDAEQDPSAKHEEL